MYTQPPRLRIPNARLVDVVLFFIFIMIKTRLRSHFGRVRTKQLERFSIAKRHDAGPDRPALGEEPSSTTRKSLAKADTLVRASHYHNRDMNCRDSEQIHTHISANSMPA